MDNVTVSTPQSELEDRLLNETDLNELNRIIEIFNLNIKRKDIVRANKLSDLQDLISNQIQKRVEARPDEFSNADLLNYFKVLQETLNKSNTSVDVTKVPSIQINQQNNVNVDIDGGSKLTKDSRDRVMDAVQSIIGKLGDTSNLPGVIEVDNE